MTDTQFQLLVIVISMWGFVLAAGMGYWGRRIVAELRRL